MVTSTSLLNHDLIVLVHESAKVHLLKQPPPLTHTAHVLAFDLNLANVTPLLIVYPGKGGN